MILLLIKIPKNISPHKPHFPGVYLPKAQKSFKNLGE